MLNRFQNQNGGEAKIRYLDGDFQIVQPGSYVTCAITGKHIPIDELKYWNVERQVAYVDASASLKGHLGQVE